VSVSRNRKIKSTSQVDAFQACRRNLAQVVGAHGLAIYRFYRFYRFQGVLHVQRVPSHHGIRQQRQRRRKLLPVGGSAKIRSTSSHKPCGYEIAAGYSMGA